MEQVVHILDPTNWLSWLALAAGWVAHRLGWRRRRWHVRLRHHNHGTIVCVRRWPRTSEAGRVGFDRPKSANPDNDFNEQFGIVMGRARDRCRALNAAERNARDR